MGKLTDEFFKLLNPRIVQAAMPDQNYGGCGYFALEVYNLMELLGFFPKIRACFSMGYSGCNADYYRNLSMAQDLDRNDMDELIPGHVYIEVDNYFIDADGCVPLNHKVLPAFRLDLSHSELEFLLRCEGWNAWYNTEQNTQLKDNFLALKNDPELFGRLKAA